MKSSIKILHLVSGELSGGAAKGAYNLHLALKKEGVQSQILTSSKTTLNDESIITLSSNIKQKLTNKILSKLDSALVYPYKKRLPRIFSSNVFGRNLTKTQAYKEADIIHLHWINDGFISLYALKHIKKPIIWTLRDMWAMTGGCHYNLTENRHNMCQAYEYQCGKCPTLRSQRQYDLSYLNFKHKKSAYHKEMKIIAPSDFIYQCAKKSALLKNLDMRVIPNCIDTQEFFPIDKTHARLALNLHTHKKIILCGANTLSDFYKGFELFLEMLTNLDKNKYFLCFFGNLNSTLLAPLGFEFRGFGYHNSSIALRILYSAADVFIAPSIVESFGKTITESLACGTPVVAFDYSSPRDIIAHKHNGYLAKSFEAKDLASGVEWITNLHSHHYQMLKQYARQSVLDKFSLTVVAKAYIETYEQLAGGGDNVKIYFLCIASFSSLDTFSSYTPVYFGNIPCESLCGEVAA